MVQVKSVSEVINEISPHYKKKQEPDAKHTLTYDSSAEALEPVYFFITDLMNEVGLAPEKIVDNFTSTAGGTHFSEVGMKASRIQDEAMKILGNANAVLRSVLNIIYDLRDFKIRLEHYDNLEKGDKDTKEAARLALKQIWMDKVDIAKGNSSIKAMALGQMGFQTLIDAFLIANTPKEVDDLDLNDRVKRILKPRVIEFNLWLEQSEKELRKRYEIEKTYLKSQVSALKLYSRWVKPYLKAAHQLEMKEPGREVSLVNMFNTVRFELTLLGKKEVDVKAAALTGELPVEFEKLKTKRKYYSCILVDFIFTGIPRQGALTGKTEVTFRGYSLNQDELDKLDIELEKSDIGDVLSLIEGATTESLDQLQEEINFYLEDVETKKQEKSGDESNPFLALIGYYDRKEKKKEAKKPDESKTSILKEKPVRKDDFIEKEHLRKLAIEKAKDTAFDLFDIYKKAHAMASFT